MVRAIIEGRKTQTRRMMKPQPYSDHAMQYADHDSPDLKCPYGENGSRLWVRETFAPHPEFNRETIYRADRGGDYQGAAQGDFKWKPSIFMPRAASRITLEIVSVRCARLQDISEADAKAEGCRYPAGGPNSCYAMAYMHLWESINGAGSWDKNPWLWAITFKRIPQPPTKS